jgi:hypothetical protein
VQYIHSESIELGLLMGLAKDGGYVPEAYANSYPDVIDECRGLIDELGTWSLDECLIMSYADIIVEFVTNENHLNGCSQFAAIAPATAGTQLIHGRNLDWGNMTFVEQHPVVFVRSPQGKIPYVAVGFPGNVTPYTGMNAAGIAIASNENDALSDRMRGGRSHVQMLRQILQDAHSLDEAESFLRAQVHSSAETLVISDGTHNQAGVFEMTAHHLGVRRLSPDGIVYATNHFVDPDMAELDLPEPEGGSTLNRFERLRELLEPGLPDSHYGTLDVPGAIAILRDSYNPFTHETLPQDLPDDGNTIVNNANLQSVVFIPGQGVMYVALGTLPAAMHTFVGFSVHELLGEDDAAAVDPAQYP